MDHFSAQRSKQGYKGALEATDGARAHDARNGTPRNSVGDLYTSRSTSPVKHRSNGHPYEEVALFFLGKG